MKITEFWPPTNGGTLCVVKAASSRGRRYSFYIGPGGEACGVFREEPEGYSVQVRAPRSLSALAHNIHFARQRRLAPGLGHRLRVVRIALGISAAAAADVFGVAQKTYLSYEAGRAMRGNAGFYRFCARYDLPLGWLFEGDGTLEPRRRLLDRFAESKVAVLPVSVRLDS